MDKIIYYNVFDTTNNDESIMMKISSLGFPIEEKIEYENNGSWAENISLDENFNQRLTSLLDDNNIRLIMDLLQEDDEFYNNKYKIRLTVTRLEINDDY